MPNSVWSEKDLLTFWIEDNCRHLDLIASWDELVYIYEHMKFIDEINDSMRLDEFKSIIVETNRFLTRMKTGLLSCADLSSAIEYLKTQADTKDMGAIKTRPQVAYNRQRQQWVVQAIKVLSNTLQLMDAEREENEDA